MAIFDKGKKSAPVEGKKLSEIVYQMLVENVPDEQILINLQQLGLDESRAKQVLSKAKTEFGSYIENKLSFAVEKLVNEKLDKWSAKRSKKSDLLFDLKVAEQKKYVDNVKLELMDEINGLKSDFAVMKMEVASKLSLVDKTVDLLKISGSSQKLMSVMLLIGGVLAIASGLFLANSLIQSLLNSPSLNITIIINLFVVFILFIAGIVALNIGFKIYSLGSKTFEKVGADFIRKKREEEEQTIQDLVKDEDVV